MRSPPYNKKSLYNKSTMSQNQKLFVEWMTAVYKEIDCHLQHKKSDPNLLSTTKLTLFEQHILQN